MFRANILGKVGYFKTIEEVVDFAFDRFKNCEDDIILKEIQPSVEDIQRDFLNLKRFNTKRLDRSFFVFRNLVGIKIANYFMGFRLNLRAKNKKTILEGMRDKKGFHYFTQTHFRMQRTNDIKSIKDIFDRARIRGGTQELNNFPPMVAKTIYEKYCPMEDAKLLDWSAGFGGRLIGAMSSRFNYNYVGIDPSTKAVEGLNKLIDFLNVRNRAKIIQKPFEDCDSDLEDNYKEIYSNEETQSCIKYPEIEKWRIGFLLASFKILMKKLKEGAFLLVNIANITDRGKEIDLENMTIEVGKEVGFEYLGFKKMLIGNRFSSLSRRRVIKKRRDYNFEKIFVFKKPIRGEVLNIGSMAEVVPQSNLAGRF